MKITVVIPCRNEVLYIEECIHAIYSCDLPAETNIEIFVVDGMSDDGTRDKVKAMSLTYPSLDIVDNVKQLTPFAFNLGIYAGKHTDFIQIVGARHILSSNYIVNCFTKLQSDSSTWCVGGKIENEYINEVGEVISRAMGTTFGMGLGNFRTLEKSGFTDTVTSPMYPYWVFDKIGFFDEELIRNQDDDFNYRVTSEGGQIFYDNDISLKYYVRGNFKGLWRQFFQYGYWKVYVNKKHKAITTLRQLVPPAFALYLALLIPILFVGKIVFLVSLIPLEFYVVLNIIFSLRAMPSAKKILHTLITFPLIHISYGLGYLKGLVEFILLNKKPSESQKRLSR
ncbi:MAG: glycosyltransferase family 2 protein [Crocinitomicaceae bacterium]